MSVAGVIEVEFCFIGACFDDVSYFIFYISARFSNYQFQHPHYNIYLGFWLIFGVPLFLFVCVNF